MHWLQILAFDFFKRHFLCFALCPAFPDRKQFRIRLFQVAFNGNIQTPGGRVNPVGFAFDLAKVTDGSFIDYDVAVGVGPFTTKLFITEAGAEAYGFYDPAHGISVLYLGFNFPAGFMPARLFRATVFVRDCPAQPIFPESEQRAPAAQFAAGLIKQGIHLMGARSNEPESSRLETGSESVNVVDSELDFDFAISGHDASIKK